MKKIIFPMVLLVIMIVSLVAGCAAPEAAPAETITVTAPAAPAAAPEVIKWRMTEGAVAAQPFGPYTKNVFQQNYSQGWIDWITDIAKGRIEVELLDKISRRGI